MKSETWKWDWGWAWTDGNGRNRNVVSHTRTSLISRPRSREHWRPIIYESHGKPQKQKAYSHRDTSETHTHPFNGPFPGLPRWAGTRKVKPVWILLKQETVSSSGISWAICKSAPRSRQITMLAPQEKIQIKLHLWQQRLYKMHIIKQ